MLIALLFACCAHVPQGDGARELVARCASEVEWAGSWEEAAERGRREGKPVLVCVRWLGGFKISDAVRTSTFMDLDIVALTNERLVPLQLAKGDPAPIVEPSSYGMGPYAFGSALLFCTPEGQVLHDTNHLDPYVVDSLLVEWLKDLPEYPGTPAPDDIDLDERIERLLRRGELDTAFALAEKSGSARAHLVRAKVHRRRHDGEQAMGELARARNAVDSEQLERELDEEELEILMRRGLDADARELAAYLSEKNHAAAPAARYWLGVLATRQRDFDAARAYWEALVEELPDERWAWAAAAGLASTTFELGYPVMTEFPDAEVMRDLRARPLEPSSPDALGEVRQEAVSWLVARQHTNGSWLAARHSTRSSDRVTNPFTDSVTAIAGMACLEGGELDAARRALGFCLAARKRREAAEYGVVFMDYTAYADAWIVRFLADALEARLGDTEELRAAISDHIAALGERQRANGGWSYYLSRQVDAGEAPEAQSISFITGLVALALLRAEEVGVALPGGLRDGALDCLEAMRGEEGTFAYMLFVGASAPPTGAPGAAGRSPVCELALLRAGRSDIERLRGALELFYDHADALAKEAGKALMHCGPAGEGCHYIFFDYATAAEAVASLPEDERGRFRARLIELMLATRSDEGSFRDTPINGWAYGTAMALLAFGDLSVESR